MGVPITSDTDLLDGLTAEDIQKLALDFMLQYYYLMNKTPDQLHRFYTNDSVLAHGGVIQLGKENVTHVVGQKGIHDKFMSLGLKDCRTRVLQLDAQKSHNNSVVIQVSGEISNNQEPMRRFMQTFVLVAKMPNNFYVCNDIFRFQDEVFGDEIPTTSNHVTSGLTTATIDVSTNQILIPNTNQDTNQYDSYGSSNEQDADETTEDAMFSSNAVPDYQAGSHDLDNDLEKPSESVDSLNFTSKNAYEQNSDPQSQYNLQDDVLAGSTSELQNDTVEPDSSTDSKQVTPSVPETSQNVSKGPENTGPSSWASIISKSSQPIVNPTILPKKFIPMTNGDAHNTGNAVVSISAQAANVGNVTKPSTTKPAPPPANPAPDSHQVFVGNLPTDLQEPKLTEFFEKFGTVIDVRINQSTGLGKNGRDLPNFGFVTFDDAEAVRNVLGCKPLLLDNGHRLNVEEKKSQGSFNVGRSGMSNGTGYGGGARGGITVGKVGIRR